MGQSGHSLDDFDAPESVRDSAGRITNVCESRAKPDTFLGSGLTDIAAMDGLVRRGTPSDGEAIAAIYDPIVADTTISFEETPPGADEMRRRILAAADRYPWLVLERERIVAGYAYASPHRSRAAYRWSVDVSVYVAPSARRCGIARSLYAALFELLARQGFHAAFAGVALPNDASLRLHRSAGFTDVGTYHEAGFKLGRWHDVTWLERRLRPGDVTPAEPRSLAALESDSSDD